MIAMPAIAGVEPANTTASHNVPLGHENIFTSVKGTVLPECYLHLYNPFSNGRDYNGNTVNDKKQNLMPILFLN